MESTAFFTAPPRVEAISLKCQAHQLPDVFPHSLFPKHYTFMLSLYKQVAGQAALSDSLSRGQMSLQINLNF
jgi:hypothetical protein